ncbi:hypothetical protein [Wolbachia endosymbiont (group A) of Oxytorus armatus]|uniref:hypothetical protein n=1 Tax=Wolbachia endosymbiont (group A) of Oxytorus armatus TaxID=3066211 RepID=UPI0031332042
MSNSVEKLVNAFNLNNYFCERVNTNFTVKGNKIVGLFADDTDVAEYLHRIGEEIIKQHYSSGSEVARKYYNLNYFPFVLGANPSKKKSDIKGVMEVKLADSVNREVIHNLKIHLVNEFRRAVILKLVARLQKAVGITEEKAHEWVGKTFGIAATGKSSSYLYCIVFSDEYLRKEGYDSETFELLKREYIKEFYLRLENCGLKSSDFYEYKDDMLYIKNISDKVVRSVAEYERGRVALDFRTPGTEDSKVENFKDVLGDFIFKWTGKPINAYGYDIFADEGKIGSGNNFVLIPLTKACDDQLEFLKRKDVYKINIEYKNLMSDIRGKTADPDINSCENPIYAFSNKGIAQLLPKIMESAITYNKENKRFEFAVDPGNFRRRDSIRGSQSSSTVNSPLNSPTHAGPSGLRTPPNQRDRDSGYDSNSPPKPKDSGSSSGGPSSGLTELSSPTQEFPKRSRGKGLKRPPRQGSEREEGKGGLFQLVPGEIDPSQSTCGQSQLSSGEIDLSQSTCDQSQLSLGTGEGMLTEDNIPDQKRSSSIPPPIAWDDSTFLNPEVSNEESEKQQVTDKSDRKSSDECSKAKPQKQERDSVYSSASTPEGSVSKKPSLSNPPSGVTSPVTEPDDGGFLNRPKIRALRSKTNGGIPEPLPQDAVSKPNVPGDRNSKISKDSGFESLERPQSNSSITTSTVPGISESRKDLNPPVDNKRPQSLPLAGFSTCASNETVKAFLCFLDYFSSSEGKKQLPSLLSSEAGKQLSSISDPCEQENLLDFLFSTERSKQLCSLFSSENKQQLHSLFSLKGKELLFSPSPEGQKLIPLVLSPKGKEKLPLLLSPEGEQISKPFSPEAGNIISLLIYSRVEPKNMSHRSFRDKLAKWLHRNSSLSKLASPQEKPLTNDEKKELRPFLCPNLQKKLDSNSLEDEQLKYLLYTPGGKEKLDLLLSSPEKEEKQLHSDLPLKTKKGLLFKFFGDEQEISRNVSTSSADSGLGKSLERGQSPSLIEKFNDKSLINSRVDSPNIKKYLQEGKEVFV